MSQNQRGQIGVQIFVGAGGNMGDSLALLTAAFTQLAAHPEMANARRSRWYRSKAVGPGVQDDYTNGVFALETRLGPENLLELLQSLEHEHGRQRTVRWGPRTLDLDLLVYGDEVINTASLQVPHPRLQERNFVIFHWQSLLQTGACRAETPFRALKPD